jgi:hypothetical protein
MDKKPTVTPEEAQKLITARIAELKDWRGQLLAKLRALILAADPDIVEEWKWGIPVWSRRGLITTGEVYARAVKLTFASGASLDDPSKLFNSSLEGKVRRAIDFKEGEGVNARAFQALVKAAVALNESKKKKTKATSARRRSPSRRR